MKSQGINIGTMDNYFCLNILVFFIRKNLQLLLHLEHEDGHDSNIKIFQELFQELLALAVLP